MSERATVFCPFCNADGAKQPILSPMVCVYVLGAPTSSEAPAGAVQAAGKPGSHFEYRCPRCGFTEIHERLVDEAA